jgi:hypothetical protein
MTGNQNKNGMTISYLSAHLTHLAMPALASLRWENSDGGMQVPPHNPVKIQNVRATFCVELIRAARNS